MFGMIMFSNTMFKRHASFFLLAFMLLTSSAPVQVFAAGLTTTPVVVDDKAKARDILRRSITIQNASDHKLFLYPSVNDIHPANGAVPFVSAQTSSDRTDSLANWIELSRGMIEINPGEEKTVPFVIRVASNAAAGTYHAAITFGQGGDRASAEATPPLSTVTVNVEVQDDVKEFLQLDKFTTDKLFFSGDDVLFNFQLENIGNQELQPKGEIRIYDRKGSEVASVEVNSDGKKFSPDQMLQLASVWSAARGFGRYKAFLNIDYGSSQVASVQDTVYFWILPWQQLLGLFIATLIAVVWLALYYHRWLEQRHREKFGLAPVAAAIVEPRLPSSRGVFGFASRAISGASSMISQNKKLPPAPMQKMNDIHDISASASASTPMPTPRPTLREAIPIVQQTESSPPQQPIGMRSEPLVQNYGEVIDLKHIRAQKIEEEPTLNVINLKKRP